MEFSCFRARHGRQIVRAGATLLLLAMLLGFLVPRFALPRAGLSAHLLGVSQGILLLTTGQLWGRLAFTPALSRAASGLVVGGAFAAWIANVAAAAWGAGGAMLSHAAGMARGSDAQELMILLLLRGAGLALVVGWMLILWGLRGAAPQSAAVAVVPDASSAR